MESMELTQVLRFAGIPSEEAHTSIQITNVVDDPYDCEENTVFFNLPRKRERHPWHLYERYENCYIVTDDKAVSDEAAVPSRVFNTENVSSAYWRFVDTYRRQFKIPVIGVTGTCGKSTTKEMIVHILSQDRSVQATIGSKNASWFNLPYLLGIESKTETAVFEMAVGAPDDIQIEARYFRPTVGVITNIGVAHLDECHTLENYIQAKAQMLQAINNQGHLVINDDDINIATIDLSSYHGVVHRFGLGERAEYQAKEIAGTTSGKVEFVLAHQGASFPVRVRGLGEHTVYNALAAIAAACSVGVPVEQACELLETYQPLRSHLQVFPGADGCTIIDDTWGSNPTSTETAIRVLRDLAGNRKTVFVTGRMHPLGDYYDEATESVARAIIREYVDVLVTKGTFARDIGRAVIRLGMPIERVYMCSEVEEIAKVLELVVERESVVLFKNWGEDDSFTPLIRSMTRD